jgi:hypothetical protein
MTATTKAPYPENLKLDYTLPGGLQGDFERGVTFTYRSSARALSARLTYVDGRLVSIDYTKEALNATTS